MIDLSKIDNIYLVPGATDMRKSADGCAAIVQYQLYCNPFSTNIFIFCNKTKNIIKILEWDGNGFWVHTKKLIGKDRFRWPKASEGDSMIIDERQLEWLLDGLEIHQKHAHHTVEPVMEMRL
ncbi:MAG: IS66 family insertion sequence element accessory protein TnpB [Erysipelotrichaceae bacterium]|nr:IS66 family insertion sequence element accessory protein TnpB [Erysipelotrichaceae bacterium]